MFEPEIGGQNHDRMETDEESDDSNSEADTSQSGETPASNGGADVTTADPEAMDTTPDDLGPGEAGPSWNPGVYLKAHSSPWLQGTFADPHKVPRRRFTNMVLS